MFTFFFYFNNFIFLEDRLRYDWRIFSFDMLFLFSSLEQKLQSSVVFNVGGLFIF